MNLEVDDEEPAVDVAPKGNSLFSEVEDRRHIGQAHHMFSRFLNLRIFSRIFLCFVFLQGRSKFYSDQKVRLKNANTIVYYI